MAGFIKRTTTHCYTQNMEAIGLVVSEKKIFSHYKSMGSYDHRGGAIFEPVLEAWSNDIGCLQI